MSWAWLGVKPAVLLLSASLSAECNLLLKAQRFAFRCTLHRACFEWKQWLKMTVIHTTGMHYSHTPGCVCFMCVCYEADIQIAKMQAFLKLKTTCSLIEITAFFLFVFLSFFLFASSVSCSILVTYFSLADHLLSLLIFLLSFHKYSSFFFYDTPLVCLPFSSSTVISM